VRISAPCRWDRIPGGECLGGWIQHQQDRVCVPARGCRALRTAGVRPHGGRGGGEGGWRAPDRRQRAVRLRVIRPSERRDGIFGAGEVRGSRAQSRHGFSGAEHERRGSAVQPQWHGVRVRRRGRGGGAGASRGPPERRHHREAGSRRRPGCQLGGGMPLWHHWPAVQPRGWVRS